MADTGWVIAGAGDSINTAGAPWNTPNNCTVDDGTDTTCSVLTTQGDDLKAYTFGSLVPAGATINGIEVRFQTREISATASTNISYINVGKDDSTLGTAKTPATALTTSHVDYDYGGATDLWGLSWTAAEINSSSFQIRMRCSGTNISDQVGCDAAWVKVYYTEGADYTEDLDGADFDLSSGDLSVAFNALLTGASFSLADGGLAFDLDASLEGGGNFTYSAGELNGDFSINLANADYSLLSGSLAFDLTVSITGSNFDLASSDLNVELCHFNWIETSSAEQSWSTPSSISSSITIPDALTNSWTQSDDTCEDY